MNCNNTCLTIISIVLFIQILTMPPIIPIKSVFSRCTYLKKQEYHGISLYYHATCCNNLDFSNDLHSKIFKAFNKTFTTGSIRKRIETSIISVLFFYKNDDFQIVKYHTKDTDIYVPNMCCILISSSSSFLPCNHNRRNTSDIYGGLLVNYFSDL